MREFTNFLGIKSADEVLKELERRKSCRIDNVVSSDNIRFSIEHTQHEPWILIPEHSGPLTRRSSSQLFELIGLPQRARYTQWLLNNAKDFPNAKGKECWVNQDLLLWTLNSFFGRMKFDRLVRMMKSDDGTTYCRALLSNRYKIVDSYDLFFAILEQLSKLKMGGKSPEVWHSRLSEDHFYGYAVAPGLTGQVDHTRTFSGVERWKGMPQDTYNAAICFGNSETGSGGVFIRQAIVRSVTKSYVVGEDVVSERHVGKRLVAEADLSTETIKAWNAAFFSEVQDHVKNAFDPDCFQAMLDRMNGATRDNVEDGVIATDALQVCYDLSEAAKARIRNQFFQRGDMTRYGLVSAISEVAASGMGADESVALEQASCDLSQLSMADVFKKVASTHVTRSPLDEMTEAVRKPARRRRTVLDEVSVS